MGVSSDMRSSRVRRQAAKKPNKERTVQVRFSDEELAALDAICSEKKMTRSAFLRSCVEKVQGGDVEPTYVVTRNADAERMASEAKSIPVEGGAFLAWGHLTYTRPLTEKEASDYELRPAPVISELSRKNDDRPLSIAQQMKEAGALAEASQGDPIHKKKAPDRGDR